MTKVNPKNAKETFFHGSNSNLALFFINGSNSNLALFFNCHEILKYFNDF